MSDVSESRQKEEWQKRRILVLSKRQYSGKDLIDDRFGRLREIPIELSHLGHNVRGVALSYQERPDGVTVDRRGSEEVVWTSVGLGRTWVPGIIRHRRVIENVAADLNADVVFAASDAFHVIRGVSLARRIGAVAFVDLFDNFESFRGMAFPRMVAAYRRAVVAADIVTCVSEPLMRIVQNEYQRTGPTEVVENGVPRDLFIPGDRNTSRRRLGLPEGVLLVGIAGALLRNRDVETVFRAVDRLNDGAAPVGMVVAGAREPDLEWPQRAKVFDLGMLPHARVPDLIRSADVMVVPNLDSEFGSYCFPQKAAEAIACNVPVVAAQTPVTKELMSEAVDGLYRVGDTADLARALQQRLSDRRVLNRSAKTWAQLAAQIDELIHA